MSLRKQIDKLSLILKQNGFNISWELNKQVLRIGSKEFRPPLSPQDFIDLPKGQGLILQRSSKDLRKSLQDHHINYIDPHGHIYFDIGPRHKLIIEEISSQKKHISKLKNKVPRKISPTLLVSPNAFALVDTLFKVGIENINTPSIFQFCKKYNLYQPKVSKIMTGLGAKTLTDLVEAIKSISIEWWLFAFDSPITKRKMTPFFENAQDYYSLNTDLEKLNEHDLLQKINTDYKNDVVEGPTVVAKFFGELVDPGLSFWISPAQLSQFKQQFRLVAGRKEGARSWTISSSRFGNIKEGLIGHDVQNISDIKVNRMRAIWDLGFGESRLREIRGSLLRKVLK